MRIPSQMLRTAMLLQYIHPIYFDSEINSPEERYVVLCGLAIVFTVGGVFFTVMGIRGLRNYPALSWRDFVEIPFAALCWIIAIAATITLFYVQSS